MHMKETIFLHWVLKEGRDVGMSGDFDFVKIPAECWMCKYRIKYKKSRQKNNFLLDFLFVC